ncbi:MAG: hypothetical protein M9894_08790 [Planctomycetes bacterium]|nr:hypothetical protein [Planctomycetota bacterium]
MDGDAKERVRVGQSALRCPYCHDDVAVEAQDWLACARCLARHHAACWTESGRCGGCGAAEALARAGSAPVRAAEPHEPAPGVVERLLGAPLRLRVVRTVLGEVGPEVDEEAVEAARRVLGDPGHTSRVGRTLTWRHAPGSRGGRDLTLVVASRDGATTLEVEERLGNLVGGLWGGLGGGLGVNLLVHPLVWGVVKDLPWLVGLGIGFTALFLIGLRALVGALARRRRDQVVELAARVEAALARHAVRPPRADPKADPKAS